MRDQGEGFVGDDAAITALDPLAHFVGLLSPDGVVLDANAAALQAGGLTRDQVVGRPLWEARWWQHSERVQAELRAAIERAASGEDVRYFVDVLAADAGRSLVTIDFRLTPVRGADGSVRFLVPEGQPASGVGPPRHGSDDSAWAEVVGDLVAARRQMDQLRNLATAVAAAGTIAEVAVAIAERAADVLGASFSNVVVVAPGSDQMELYHPVSLGDIAARWGMAPVDDTTVLGEALQARRPVHVENLDELALRYPRMVADAAAAGLQALAGYPLDSQRSPMRAALGLGWVDPRQAAEPAEIAPVLALCGAALHRAWTSDELARLAADRREREELQRRIAVELQAGLLPARIPHIDGWDVAVRYRASARGLDVGGDWYDLMEVDDDDFAVVVGDVVGHDVRAAIGMSQLRNALAGLSHARSEPASVVERLDDFATHSRGLLGATVFYARLQPRTGVLHYTLAGHPPPIVVRADGTTRFLCDGRATPVGVTLGPHRPSGRCDLAVGDTLLCYTDGLIERRDEPITVGMERLGRAARAIRLGAPLEELTDVLLHELPPSQVVDDIAMLAVRRVR